MQRNKKRRKNPIRTVYIVFCMYGIEGKKWINNTAFLKNKNLAFQKISLKLHFLDIFKAMYWLISCKIKPNYIIWLGDVNCVHSKWRSFDVANLSSRFQRFARIFFSYFILYTNSYIIPSIYHPNH